MRSFSSHFSLFSQLTRSCARLTHHSTNPRCDIANYIQLSNPSNNIATYLSSSKSSSSSIGSASLLSLLTKCFRNKSGGIRTLHQNTTTRTMIYQNNPTTKTTQGNTTTATTTTTSPPPPLSSSSSSSSTIVTKSPTQIPTMAKWLGYAGLIPFITTGLAVGLGYERLQMDLRDLVSSAENLSNDLLHLLQGSKEGAGQRKKEVETGVAHQAETDAHTSEEVSGKKDDHQETQHSSIISTLKHQAIVDKIGSVDIDMVDALAYYGACILSFLGGIHWGLAIQKTAPMRLSYLYSVTPSLLAWSSLLLPDRCFTLPMQVISFSFAWVYDMISLRGKQPPIPAWFFTLRTRLTAGAIISLQLASTALFLKRQPPSDKQLWHSGTNYRDSA